MSAKEVTLNNGSPRPVYHTVRFMGDYSVRLIFNTNKSISSAGNLLMEDLTAFWNAPDKSVDWKARTFKFIMDEVNQGLTIIAEIKAVIRNVWALPKTLSTHLYSETTLEDAFSVKVGIDSKIGYSLSCSFVSAESPAPLNQFLKDHKEKDEVVDGILHRGVLLQQCAKKINEDGNVDIEMGVLEKAVCLTPEAAHCINTIGSGISDKKKRMNFFLKFLSIKGALPEVRGQILVYCLSSIEPDQIAAFSQEVEKRQLLEQGSIEVDVPNGRFVNAIQNLLKFESFSILKVLMKTEAFHRSSLLADVMQYAIRLDWLEMIDFSLEHVHKPFETDDALFQAIQFGKVAIVRLFIAKMNCNPYIDVNGINLHFGLTPLTCAVAHSGNEEVALEIIEALLDAGADVNKPDRYGNTPLVLATLHGSRIKIATFLIQRDAKISTYVPDYKITLVNGVILQCKQPFVDLLLDPPKALSVSGTRKRKLPTKSE